VTRPEGTVPEIPEAPLGDDPLAPVRPLPPVPLRDRIGALVDGWRLAPGRAMAGVIAAIVVVAIAAGGLAWTVGRRAPVAPPAAEIRLPTAAGAAGAPGAPGGSTSTTAGDVVVHAAGAVAHPGVYRLRAGARVTDLIEAAGGLAPGADPDRLNLAAVLRDGERLWVPRLGEASAPAVVAVEGGAGLGGQGGAGDEVVDLNHATVDELEALPGVGPATAQAIVDYRREHGPFRSVDDLLEVRGIGDAKLAQLRPRVRV
jgi:competence protein ComEA